MYNKASQSDIQTLSSFLQNTANKQPTFSSSCWRRYIFEVLMKAHGSYKLEVNNNTITFTAYDAWNYEAAIEWGNELKNIVAQMNNEPWAFLSDLTEWELITPGATGYISELYSWVNDQNFKYLAVVFGLSIQKSLLEEHHKIFTNVEINYFGDLDEANCWLNSVGF
jgi:hypothetical protein